jgi:hypothetical protein
VNTAWMRGALLAASMAGWMHQLTAATRGKANLAGRGTRGGKAMIATLRWRLISVPGRLVRHAGQLTLRLPAGHGLLSEILARLRAFPRDILTTGRSAPTGNLEIANPALHPDCTPARTRETAPQRSTSAPEINSASLLADSGLTDWILTWFI